MQVDYPNYAGLFFIANSSEEMAEPDYIQLEKMGRRAEKICAFHLKRPEVSFVESGSVSEIPTEIADYYNVQQLPIGLVDFVDNEIVVRVIQDAASLPTVIKHLECQ